MPRVFPWVKGPGGICPDSGGKSFMLKLIGFQCIIYVIQWKIRVLL